MVSAKLFTLSSAIKVEVDVPPDSNNESYIKYTSFATVIVQLIVRVAVLPLVAAVAVNKEVVLPNTVGEPVTESPEILNPVGNVSEVYVIDLPAALDADKAVVEAVF
jgi:hypothetical protein